MIIDNIQDKLKEYYGYGNVRTRYYFDAAQEDKPVATSYLGTPIFSNVVFERVSYRNFDDEVRDFDGFELDICLISANNENVILETNIQGRNGAVMEMISNGDYRITVNGFLLSENMNVAPYIIMNQLEQMRKSTASIKVNSAFMNALDIYEIVVNSVSFAEIEGTRNMVAVTLNLTSIIPIEIRLA